MEIDELRPQLNQEVAAYINHFTGGNEEVNRLGYGFKVRDIHEQKRVSPFRNTAFYTPSKVESTFEKLVLQDKPLLPGATLDLSRLHTEGIIKAQLGNAVTQILTYDTQDEFPLHLADVIYQQNGKEVSISNGLGAYGKRRINIRKAHSFDSDEKQINMRMPFLLDGDEDAPERYGIVSGAILDEQHGFGTRLLPVLEEIIHSRQQVAFTNELSVLAAEYQAKLVVFELYMQLREQGVDLAPGLTPGEVLACQILQVLNKAHRGQSGRGYQYPMLSPITELESQEQFELRNKILRKVFSEEQLEQVVGPTSIERLKAIHEDPAGEILKLEDDIQSYEESIQKVRNRIEQELQAEIGARTPKNWLSRQFSQPIDVEAIRTQLYEQETRKGFNSDYLHYQRLIGNRERKIAILKQIL